MKNYNAKMRQIESKFTRKQLNEIAEKLACDCEVSESQTRERRLSELTRRNDAKNLSISNGIYAPFVILDKPKHQEDEELRISRLIDKDTLFRFAYVPFVIAQLVWDYADTILTTAAWLKISETKKLCRAVRELRRDYDRIHSAHIDAKHEASEVSNMYVFEDGVAGITKQLLLNIKIDLKSEYPDLDADHLSFLIAVYQCDITLKSLLLYTRKQTERIAKKIERNVGNILPESIYKLDKLILEFVGDKPVSNRFRKLKQQYIETFATQIALIEMTEIPDNE